MLADGEALVALLDALEKRFNGNIFSLDEADRELIRNSQELSRFAEFHRIAAFLHISTNKPIGIILSIGLLNELFKPKWSDPVGSPTSSSSRVMALLRPYRGRYLLSPLTSAP